jgi:hypothetical protein
MKKITVLGLASAMTVALFASTAFAGPIIDKGDLGKYERRGARLHRIMTPPPRSESTTPSVSTRDESRFIIDKGKLGKYERHGRFLRRITDIGPRNWDQSGTRSEKRGVSHDHGIGGKQHRNYSN